MTKNERTSKRIAKIAAKVLKVEDCFDILACANGMPVGITWADIRALAASCLTQAPDKHKRKSRPKPPARGRVTLPGKRPSTFPASARPPRGSP